MNHPRTTARSLGSFWPLRPPPPERRRPPPPRPVLLQGLGDLLRPPQRDQAGYGQRMLYDFSFYVVVSVCLLNIVFGIIVGTSSPSPLRSALPTTAASCMGLSLCHCTGATFHVAADVIPCVSVLSSAG